MRWLSKSEKFQKLDKLTKEHGAIMVALTRLVPIFPFNLLNYGFGLTRVPFWTYVFWSWLCMLPGTALDVVGADAVTMGLAMGKVPWGLIGAAAGVAVILAVLVTMAKRKLQAKEMKMKVPVPPEPQSEPIFNPEVKPLDEHNRVLVANVHPPDWVNPEPAPRYNLVVIGAGTAGLVTAAGAAGVGAKVALIERHHQGGDCLNYGCVPSKAIIRSAKAAAEMKDAARYGVEPPGNVQTNFGAVMERMRKLRAGISHHDSVFIRAETIAPPEYQAARISE